MPDESVITVDGKEIILMHGDSLCTDDKDYQEFRKLSRSRAWKKEFLSKSLDERLEICLQLRKKSEMAKSMKEEAIMDVNLTSVEKVFSKYNYPTFLIHGHTHRLKIHHHLINDHNCQRWVLGDWERRANYIELKEGKLKYRYINS